MNRYVHTLETGLLNLKAKTRPNQNKLRNQFPSNIQLLKSLKILLNLAKEGMTNKHAMLQFSNQHANRRYRLFNWLSRRSSGRTNRESAGQFTPCSTGINTGLQESSRRCQQTQFWVNPSRHHSKFRHDHVLGMPRTSGITRKIQCIPKSKQTDHRLCRNQRFRISLERHLDVPNAGSSVSSGSCKKTLMLILRCCSEFL